MMFLQHKPLALAFLIIAGVAGERQSFSRTWKGLFRLWHRSVLSYGTAEIQIDELEFQDLFKSNEVSRKTNNCGEKNMTSGNKHPEYGNMNAEVSSLRNVCVKSLEVWQYCCGWIRELDEEDMNIIWIILTSSVVLAECFYCVAHVWYCHNCVSCLCIAYYTWCVTLIETTCYNDILLIIDTALFIIIWKTGW